MALTGLPGPTDCGLPYSQVELLALGRVLQFNERPVCPSTATSRAPEVDALWVLSGDSRLWRVPSIAWQTKSVKKAGRMQSPPSLAGGRTMEAPLAPGSMGGSPRARHLSKHLVWAAGDNSPRRSHASSREVARWTAWRSGSPWETGSRNPDLGIAAVNRRCTTRSMQVWRTT